MYSTRIQRSFVGLLAVFLLCSFPFTAPLHAASLDEENTAKLVAGAKKEGKMLWYATLVAADADRLLKRFQEKYPFIKTELYRTGDDGMMTRIMAEAQAKRPAFDVVMITGIAGEVLKKKGLTAKYLSPERKFFPEGSRDHEGYWTDIYMNLYSIGYNTKLVSRQEAPKTWADLANPKWKKRMGMDTKSYYWFAVMLKSLGEEKGREFMKKLASQEIQFRTGQPLITQLMAAGEVSIGIALYNQVVEEMKTKGGAVEWVSIEPLIPQIHPLSVAAQAPHPNAARLFIDFMLSREGQEMLAGFSRIPSRSDVDPLIPRLKKGLSIMPFDFSIVDDYDRYIKLYRELLLRK